MKRTALVKHLEQHGCVLVRDGGRHSVVRNPTNGRTTTVPRHIEIGNLLAHTQDVPRSGHPRSLTLPAHTSVSSCWCRMLHAD